MCMTLSSADFSFDTFHFFNFYLIYKYLTLFGMRADTFIFLSFLDQILSADFKSFLEVKIDINGVNLTP